MNEELLQELKDLQVTLEGKSKVEIKAAMDAFQTKADEAMKNEVKAVKDEFNEEIKAMQTQYNEMAAEIKAKGATQVGEPKDELKSLITENFEEIKNVRKGKSYETKAVGNMTLANNLTGDQPRTYQNNVAMAPAQRVNFADLVNVIPIDGGTLTFPRETASEGQINEQGTEDTPKSKIDYDLEMIDINTNFVAGFCIYSKKMANNLSFLEGFLPMVLRRDYFKAENAKFYSELAAEATQSTLNAGNIVERIVHEQATLLALDYVPDAIVINAADYAKILLTAGPSGTEQYSLPGVVSISGGSLNINGLRVVVASWMPADNYIIGDWSMASKVVTQGLGVEFYEQDGDNVQKNNITARVEAQIALGVTRPDAFIKGNFTNITEVAEPEVKKAPSKDNTKK